ncbi:TPA: hypothetical protein ACPSKE_003266 [Legionella feeleii]
MGKEVNIVVVGAGPAGLTLVASILQEAQKNPSMELRIHLIEKRTEFTRRQKLIIPTEDDLPAKELRWDKFCKQLFDPQNQFKINTAGDLVDEHNALVTNLNKRQKFLRKLLRQKDEFREPKNFSIKSLQEAMKEHIENCEVSNVKLSWHSGAGIKSFDLKNKTLVLLDNDNKIIEFDYLMLCEGEQRQLTKNINAAIEMEFSSSVAPFCYKKMGTPTYHVAARLRLKPLEKERNYYEFLEQNGKTIKLDARDLSSLGWDPRDGKPEAIFDDNLYKRTRFADPKWEPRLFIATEAPESLHKIPNSTIKRKKILEWASFFAAARLQVPPECFVIDEKGENETQSNAGTFFSDLRCVDNPVRKLPNNSYIVLLGDCAMSPYYPIGVSSAIAMIMARMASFCMTRLHEHSEPFQILIAKYQDYQLIIAKHAGGYRNEQIEMVVKYIDDLSATLEEEVNILLLAQENLKAITKQNVRGLLNKFCHLLMGCSNQSRTSAVLKECLTQLMVSEEAYVDAIGERPVREFFDDILNNRLLGRLTLKQSPTTDSPAKWGLSP